MILVVITTSELVGFVGTVDNLAENLHTGVLEGADHEYHCHFWGKRLVLEIYHGRILLIE